MAKGIVGHVIIWLIQKPLKDCATNATAFQLERNAFMEDYAGLATMRMQKQKTSRVVIVRLKSPRLTCEFAIIMVTNASVV